MIHWTFLTGSWWQTRVRWVIYSVAKKLEFFDFLGPSWYRLGRNKHTEDFVPRPSQVNRTYYRRYRYYNCYWEMTKGSPEHRY